MAARKSADPIRLAGAAAVLDSAADETASLAAGELARYLYLLTGERSRVARRLPTDAPAVVLGGAAAARLVGEPDADALGDQGYRICAAVDRDDVLVISAATSVGLLYGVYDVLERLGMGFYAGGDAFGERPAPAELPGDLDVSRRPAFDARGNMLHYNFLCGCTDWGPADWRYYFDQLARQRMNVLLMHWYDDEPGAAYEVNGEYLAGGRTPNSLMKPWGAVEALRTSEFSFDSGRNFHEEVFTSPAGADLPDEITEIRRTEAMFADATAYAKVRGVRVAAGFEAPNPGDPTDPQTVERFKARVRQFVARNPDLTYFALWQHESGACTGTTPPAADTDAGALLAERREHFEHLGNEPRIWEAVRFSRFAEIAADVLADEAPGMGMVVVGWGGDRWMRFGELCLGFDKLLPKHVVFCCHDNIDASMGPNVTTQWGELPDDRRRWAMPWVEGDIDGCLVRQPNVESLGSLAPDALAKGCQGLLTLHWRFRDVEEEIGYAARFAWDADLTPKVFYRDFAARAFGPDQAEAMGRTIEKLQKLGARWTGVRGTIECGGMEWTGWRPHFPFECDGDAAAYLAPLAQKASDVLSQVPADAGGRSGAFHLRDEQEEATRIDESRPGVAKMAEIARRLEELTREKDARRLRTELRGIEQEVFDLRAELVRFGMTGAAYGAMDGLLLPLHHVIRNAGAKSRFATLRRVRKQLAALRAEYVRDGRIARLERLDHLDATIEFALSLDATAMMLASDEAYEQAVARATEAREAGDEERAAEIAAGAYDELIAAGMRNAVRAYERKLSERCDWGVLTTLNVKHMPAYWQAVAKLESFLPAAPPRELHARGRAREVWLSWRPDGNAAAQNLYRRPAGRGRWKRVNADPLAGGCEMFVDRPDAGEYEYAVTAVDESGRESPRSHPATGICGTDQRPRIVAARPYTHAQAGSDRCVQVVVRSDLCLRDVAILHRSAGRKTWSETPMMRRFRDSFAGVIDGAEVRAGTLEWCVRATDCEGNETLWPASTEAGLPWTMTVSD